MLHGLAVVEAAQRGLAYIDFNLDIFEFFAHSTNFKAFIDKRLLI